MWWGLGPEVCTTFFMSDTEDHIRNRFPAFHEEIGRLRGTDKDFDGICGDLEALSRILQAKGHQLEPRALQDLRDSIRGLEMEILTSIAPS